MIRLMLGHVHLAEIGPAVREYRVAARDAVCLADGSGDNGAFRGAAGGGLAADGAGGPPEAPVQERSPAPAIIL